MISFLIHLFAFSSMNNSHFIQDHNSKNLSYQVEENQFYHFNYTNEFNYISHNIILSDQNERITFDNDSIVPVSKDWRKEYKVSSVKNQGNCGSCWSFSATGSVESAWAIENNVLYNLSQQELIDCSTSYGNKGCEGGSMDQAFKYIIDNGLCLNLSYPYIGQESNCEKKECKSVVSIQSFKDIEPNDEKILKRATAQQPVSVAIQANKRSFQFYKSGIYSDLDCGTQLDHGVLLVGYGYDLLQDMDYWIVKNSWGESWGENGYIRLLRNVDDHKGLCGIAMQPSIPIVS